ncbi:MAG: c-type cytochrome domain-containing protein, partial [Bacteroidota bacterium]
AGHQGGNLTHGETYLVEHAPKAVQAIAGYDGGTEDKQDWSRINTDSINLYHSFLQPALEASCTKCHNANKQNGDLRMDTPHFVFAGGDGGSIVTAGSPLESEWLRRVTLPKDNVKSMPPQGEGWDYTTVKLLEYWIKTGADTLALLTPAETPKEIKTLLLRDYGLDLRPKLFVEKIMAPALAPEKRTALEALNWSVSDITPSGSAVEVKVAPGKTLADGALQELVATAADQVCYLDLGKLSLTDTDLEPLTSLTNLNRLRLNGTQLTATTVARLQSLRHLESLNLYDTEVDDSIFEHLRAYPALKRIYLWQTQVSREASAAFAKDNPQLVVDTGFQFTTTNAESNTK